MLCVYYIIYMYIIYIFPINHRIYHVMLASTSREFVFGNVERLHRMWATDRSTWAAEISWGSKWFLGKVDTGNPNQFLYTNAINHPFGNGL